MANQKIGVMSTPNAGGTNPRTARINPCVGTAMSSQGISLMLFSGYQLKTTRQSCDEDGYLQR